ncbi:MAG TPA: phosphate ABC transporter permease subunit PstC [Candidatus Limnocylindria bacterium]|nr:phosphate ABC transporter permease subunit PstC [Candidatus Limnocylindria bacterium]
MTTVPAASRPPLEARAAKQRRRLRWRERGITWLLRLCAFSAVAGLLLIMLFVFREALPILTDRETQKEASLRGFFSTPLWQPVGAVPKYGLTPLLVGTLKVVLVAMGFAVPIGVMAAIFASEFAPPKVRELLKPVIEILAGIPSVVLGFFALIVMASWIQAVTGAPSRLNAFNAGIALALGILPTVFTVSEDALRAVPRSFREASLALGATRWQTAWNVTLPAAGAGVAAGVLLGLARAVGETMIVLMASGNAAITSANIFDSVRTLSASIAAEMAEVVVGSPHYSTLFFLGGILFVTTFFINVFAGLFVDRLRRRLAGA